VVSSQTRITAVACEMVAGLAWSCTVSLADDAGSSVHEVAVSEDALQRYAPAAAAPDALVRASFEFLLEREPRGSILRRFELPVIERYFPEYPERIAAAMRGPGQG
jgi:hypothetical protein